MAYQIEAVPMTLSHFQGQVFQSVIFLVQLCSSWQAFNWRSASRSCLLTCARGQRGRHATLNT